MVITKKAKINWPLVWRKVDKLIDSYEYAYENVNLKLRATFIFAVINSQLRKGKRLDFADVSSIEDNFKKWFRKNSYTPGWSTQKMMWKKFIVQQMNTPYWVPNK